MTQVTWHAPLLDTAALSNVRCSGEQSLVFASSIAELKMTPASLCLKFAFVTGYFSAGDSMGRLMWWNRTDTRAGDDTTIVNPDGNAGPGRWNQFV